MKTTLDGKKAGLQDARSMKVENEERRKKESKMLDGVSPIYLMPLTSLFPILRRHSFSGYNLSLTVFVNMFLHVFQ